MGMRRTSFETGSPGGGGSWSDPAHLGEVPDAVRAKLKVPGDFPPEVTAATLRHRVGETFRGSVVDGTTSGALMQLKDLMILAPVEGSATPATRSVSDSLRPMLTGAACVSRWHAGEVACR